MSIIERYSPLNLAYKVIIVTNASSPVGITVSNTLLKANALVLGTDTNDKHHSLSAATYSHFQFYRCNLGSEENAAANIIAYAKERFKAERIDGLVNLASADDDAETQAAHEELAVACAEVMKDCIDGGAIVNTLLQAADVVADAAQVVKHLISTTKGLSSKIDSKKVRCNMIAPGDKENVKPCKEYDAAKNHFGFLFKPTDGQNAHKIHDNEIAADKKATYDFSNMVLFLVSGTSQGLDGAVLTRQGQLVQS